MDQTIYVIKDGNENSYEDFVTQMKEAVSEYMADQAEVKIQRVCKNNGVYKVGISVLRKNLNISPTIYLENFYEEYQNGTQFGLLVGKLVKMVEECECPQNLDISFFTDYEKVRNKLMCKVINHSKNEELLREVPYVRFLNLSVVFYCEVEHFGVSNAGILIRKEHQERWGVTVETLYKDALTHMKEDYPPQISPIMDLLKECCPDEENLWEREKDIPMHVVTNQKRFYGASSMLYPNVWKDLAGELESNLAVLPSSVHELIVVPVSTSEEALKMEAMVREINHTQIDEQEFLSDQVYYYDRMSGRLRMAGV